MCNNHPPFQDKLKRLNAAEAHCSFISNGSIRTHWILFITCIMHVKARSIEMEATHADCPDMIYLKQRIVSLIASNTRINSKLLIYILLCCLSGGMYLEGITACKMRV